MPVRMIPPPAIATLRLTTALVWPMFVALLASPSGIVLIREATAAPSLLLPPSGFQIPTLSRPREGVVGGEEDEDEDEDHQYEEERGGGGGAVLSAAHVHRFLLYPVHNHHPYSTPPSSPSYRRIRRRPLLLPTSSSDDPNSNDLWTDSVHSTINATDHKPSANAQRHNHNVLRLYKRRLEAWRERVRQHRGASGSVKHPPPFTEPFLIVLP